MSNRGPYGLAANGYWKKAWLPFPVKGKHEAIPKGITGKDGKDPNWVQIQEWLDKRPFSNVAIRANGWIAIDVDGEEGYAALDRATMEIGELPETWRSTSWPEGASALRFQLFFRVPVGYNCALGEGKFRKRFGEHVDIIHRGHRYSIVAPSIHPDTGNTYAWYRPDGEAAGNVLPDRMQLPELPEAWLEFLRYEAAAPTGDAGSGYALTRVDPGGRRETTVSADDWYEDVAEVTDHGWTREAAQAEVDRMLARIRTVESSVNTQAGGAMREIGRFVPALLSQDEAVTACVKALTENPWHSDDWNRANGKDWTALTLASTSVTRGMEEAREVLAPGADPEPQGDSERYTDAFMSARLTREALAGRFVYTSALGWLKHDGTRWVEVMDEVVHEAARQWTLAGYLAAVETYRRAAAAGAVDWAIGDDPDIRGWAGCQGRQRIHAIVGLARGIETVLRDAADFDRDPALLNTPAGVVDLRTGQVMPHDPKQMITKITNAPYRPGAESQALKAALGALPDDVPDWLQLMLGEAVTGVSGERMVLLTGGGRNGKTLLMGSVYRALGGYAAKVPNTLLLRSRQAGAATPERMTLRGVRLAYMEETPEDGYLDANVVKDLLDAEMIDGRRLYKDTVSWSPTHSIFLNTNHPPTITDTGEGTWRRMARVDFPYRYRKTGEPLEGPQDRRGDPRLKEALGRTVEGQTALLAWLVAGAIRFYAAGSIEEAGATPVSVVASVQRWREDSDDLLRFIGEEMVLDPNAWVVGSDLYREFARWQAAQGARVLSSKAFSARLESHSSLNNRVARTQRSKDSEGLSRPGLLGDGMVHGLGARPKGWSGLRFAVEADQDQTGFELDE